MKSVFKALSVIFVFEACIYLILKYLIGATITLQGLLIIILFPIGLGLLVLTLGFDLLEKENKNGTANKL